MSATARTPSSNGTEASAKNRHFSSASAIPESAAPREQQEVDSWEANLTGADEARLHGPRGDWWWTGKSPRELLAADATALHSLPQPSLGAVTEADAKRYLDNTWTLSEILLGALQGEEAFYRPPYHHLRHPMIFYYGHPITFYTNKLYVAGLVANPIDRYMEDIFEVGVDEMSWDDMSKNAMQWPTIGEVNEYRRKVYAMVNQVIEENISGPNSTVRVDQDHPLWALFMAFEHDRIHLETSSVLMRELPLHLVRKPEFWPEVHPSARAQTARASDPRQGVDFPENELVTVNPDAPVKIGKDLDFPSYGWDNEYGSREVEVPSFAAGKFMVSNGEFYEFVKSGGYRERRFWTEDGWGWRAFRNMKWPFFWEQAGPAGKHEYKLRTLFEVVDMPWSWPVNVNKHEATAFCNWKAEKDGGGSFPFGARLAAEPEHLAMREPQERHPLQRPEDDPALVFGGSEISTQAGVNLNLAFGSETPVDLHPANANGLHDVTGNAWEWSECDFNPLPGFEVHPYYDDFSTPCFDGEHNMILGGSFMSTGDAGANLHSRYHFRPHFLQHSGFRYIAPQAPEAWPAEHVAMKLASRGEAATLAQGSGDAAASDNVYETANSVNQYLALHYGQQPGVVDSTVRAHEGRPEAALNFPQQCADLLVAQAREHGARVGDDASALDLGCAVGGSSFALAPHFGKVTGIDFSHAFVNAARAIRKQPTARISFTVPVEGSSESGLIETRLAPEAAEVASRVRFEQGDACSLPEAESLGGPFDAVLMGNLLCRLPDPRACISSLPRLVRQGGVVLMCSPFSWLEEFTPRDKWLVAEGKTSAEVLKAEMAKHGFEQVHSRDVPLLIREHERKYQYIISNAAVFVRR
ncbi:Sulfatase-modifying factor 1 [Hondaea fermentalgiana]|uniref:Sulfatase-modifying factor 1 n=1 Tax=Hondaea fermentalgiana TaxID=2315210 RepID=A0A2R5GQ78_9STRA|nr:Sulfatase-modifying factor 1 [Hondaea fermentalgiana]|eukprot:GBG32459.1 Sulfatase-modifying factor 1 [Hondaea fermentalgiana]